MDEKEIMGGLAVEPEDIGKKAVNDKAAVINPAILESFDGDIEDFITFSQKADELQEEADALKEDDGIERLVNASGQEVEWFKIRAEETVMDRSSSEVGSRAAGSQGATENIGQVTPQGTASGFGQGAVSDMTGNAGSTMPQRGSSGAEQGVVSGMMGNAGQVLPQGTSSGFEQGVVSGITGNAGQVLPQEISSGVGQEAVNSYNPTMDAEKPQWENVQSSGQGSDVDVQNPMQTGSAVQTGMVGQPGFALQSQEEYGYSGQPGRIEVSGEDANLHPINVNDPHYENYVPDPYYEYGIGEEPKGISPQELKDKSSSGLAVASLVTSLLRFVCCMGTPLSLVSLVLGIVVLVKKTPFDSNKGMALAGVIISSLELIISIVMVVLPYIMQYI